MPRCLLVEVNLPPVQIPRVSREALLEIQATMERSEMTCTSEHDELVYVEQPLGRLRSRLTLAEVPLSGGADHATLLHEAIKMTQAVQLTLRSPFGVG